MKHKWISQGANTVGVHRSWDYYYYAPHARMLKPAGKHNARPARLFTWQPVIPTWIPDFWATIRGYDTWAGKWTKGLGIGIPWRVAKKVLTKDKCVVKEWHRGETTLKTGGMLGRRKSHAKRPHFIAIPWAETLRHSRLPKSFCKKRKEPYSGTERSCITCTEIKLLLRRKHSKSDATQ